MPATAFHPTSVTVSCHGEANKQPDGQLACIGATRRAQAAGVQLHGSAQRLLSLQAAILHRFNVGRHLTTAQTHRLLQSEAFTAWREAAGVVADTESR